MKNTIKIYTIFLFLIGGLFLNFTVDDAFITFRYGKNLVEHGVWNWNPTNRELVEAYTNPLFAFLSIIPHYGKFNVLIFFKGLGVLFLFLTYRLLTNNLTTNKKWLSAAFIATNMLIFPHAFSGLETIAFFLAAFYMMTVNEEQVKQPFSSWIILIAPLIRPEGALLSMYIIYLQLISHRRLSAHTLMAISLGIAYFISRYNYFGYVFPNTYYAKTGNGIFTFLHNIKNDILPICGWLVAIIVIRLHKGRIILPVVLMCGYLSLNMTADLQMNYGYRFAWHMLFPAMFYAFYLEIRSNGDSSNIGTTAMPIIFIISIMLSFNPGAEVFGGITYYQKIMKSHRAIGRALSKYNNERLVLAVGDAGLIPYYSNMNTIDYVGLANADIGHAIKEKRKPTLPTPDILIIYAGTENSCIPLEFSHAKLGINVLMESIAKKNYGCIPGPSAAGSFYLNILVDRNLPDYDNIVNDLKKVKEDSNAEIKIRDAIFLPGLQ